MPIKRFRMPKEKESLGASPPRFSAMRFFKEVESVFNRARPKRHLLANYNYNNRAIKYQFECPLRQGNIDLVTVTLFRFENDEEATS